MDNQTCNMSVPGPLCVPANHPRQCSSNRLWWTRRRRPFVRALNAANKVATAIMIMCAPLDLRLEPLSNHKWPAILVHFTVRLK
jgi:hypothetical protein